MFRFQSKGGRRMTNEEAIEILREINYESIREDVVQATNMAINVLKQTNGNLINREEIIMKAKEEAKGMTEPFQSNFAILIEWLVDKLPTYSASPQKTGHWIKYSFPRCGEQHYKCTLCGYYINFGQWGEFYTKEFKYCPHCGGKIEGVEE